MSQPLEDRHPRVLAHLLASLNDFLPGPATDRRNPLSCRQPAKSAWAPSGYELCPDCDLDGTVKRGKHRLTCPRCGGAGCWPVDAYDNETRRVEVANGSEPDVAHAIRQFSDLTLAELERALDRLEAVRVRADEDPLWRALERQARYRVRPLWARQLRAAVAGLPSYQRFLVGWCYVEAVQPPSQLRPPFDRRLRDAVGLVSLRLPEEFVAPTWALDRAQAEQDAEDAKRKARNGTGRWARPEQRAARDAEVRRLHGLGWSTRKISDRLGVSQPTVVRVLSRQSGELAA